MYLNNEIKPGYHIRKFNTKHLNDKCRLLSNVIMYLHYNFLLNIYYYFTGRIISICELVFHLNISVKRYLTVNFDYLSLP